MIPILRILLKLYKATASPFLTMLTGGPGTGCRYEPTCSEYFVQAVEVHGTLLGSWIG
ncbi:MAG: membrane protein insertion efficiency factor YidD, partial [Verrucomicrobia bacterium]|nr:membrane protein insertion efficiency factor YidD [Verrucomicrobiota bacterium]